MGNVIDCLLKQVGQVVYEVRITGETDGDTLLDVPTYTTVNHRVYGIFKMATRELLELVATSTQGDAVFFAREQIDLTSQLQHNEILYEINEEAVIEPLHTGLGYAYVVTRKSEQP